MKKCKAVFSSFLSFLCTFLILFASVCFPVSAEEDSVFQAFYDFYTVDLEKGYDSYVCYSRFATNSYFEIIYYNSDDVTFSSNDSNALLMGFTSCYRETYRISYDSPNYSFSLFSSETFSSYYCPIVDMSLSTVSNKHSILRFSSSDISYLFPDGTSYFFQQTPLKGVTLLQKLILESNNQLQQQTFPAVGTIVTIAVGCLALVVIFLLLLPKVLKKFGIR